MGLNLNLNFFLHRKLWKDCFTEAGSSLSTIESNNLSIRSLRTKLIEYEKLFEKYFEKTEEFSSQNNKLRPISLRRNPDLKFIPTNLHCEQFLVENSDSITSCYDFVSVGAFAFFSKEQIWPR